MTDKAGAEVYIKWLAGLHARRTGIVLPERQVVDRAFAILRSHHRRMPGEEDFVSQVAAEVAERLCEPGLELDQDFFSLLNRAADTVRHRVVREVKKRMVIRTSGEVTTADERAREVQSAAIEKEIAESLSLEEQAVLAAYLQGHSVAETAEKLGVSIRTFYRRLKDIEMRLRSGEPQ